MAMNPISNNSVVRGSNFENVDVDCCSICLGSLQQSPRTNFQPLVIHQSSSLLTVAMSTPSFSDSKATTICTVGICGHCFHAPCFMEWNNENLERKTSTTCPICRCVSRFCLTINDRHPNLGKASSDVVVVRRTHQESPYTAACVPCGHIFYGEEVWNEWSEKTIQAKEEQQKSFRYSAAQQRQRPSHGKCPLCGVAVTCVIRSNIQLPSNNSITLLNHLISNDSSVIATNSNMSSYVVAGIPERISVSGAGNPVVNGIYHWNGKFNHDSNRYIRYGIWNNMLCNFNIFLCQMQSGKYYWYISVITDFGKEATEHDIDFYRASSSGEYSTTVPPLDGWDVVGSGTCGWKPNPVLTYQYNNHNPSTISDNKANTDNCTAIGMEVMNFAIDSDELSPIPVCPYYIIVEGAGNPAVNGTYVHNGYLEGAPHYLRYGYWNNMCHRFCIFLCCVGKDTKLWYISVAPYNIDPGTSLDIDFYIATFTETSTTLPPRFGWINADKGNDPAPQLMYLG